MIEIQEPFHSAGDKYGFETREGVGISLTYLQSLRLKGDKEVKMTIKDRDGWYSMPLDEALIIFKAHKSKFVAGTTKLVVLPTAKFKHHDDRENRTGT